MRKIVSSAATAVAAKSLDGRLLSKEGIARLVDNVALQGGSRGRRDELNVIQLLRKLDMQYRL